MVDIPSTTPPALSRDVGGTVLGLLLQALTWTAFGTCFAFGWQLGGWFWAKV